MGLRPITMLTLATVAFTVNFWAWNLLSPLAPLYRQMLKLSPVQVSVMVAVPVLVGALGRIPLGALTDRYGGRVVFGVTCLVGALAVLFLAWANAYWALLLGGFVLGITGATFAIGVPFVSAWFPPERRGFALGVYGMGNIGSAIAGFVAPPLARHGRPLPFLVAAVALVVMGLVMLLLARDAPGRRPVTDGMLVRVRRALALRSTQELAALYAITFGGYVAFSVYLPTYLREAYGLSLADAAVRAAGFIVVATLARPVGGWLSDRFDGVRVLRVALGGLGLLAIVAAFDRTLALATIAFLGLAVCLGLGNGAVFSLLPARVPASAVGSATGVIGAAGGLGGFVPPILMGLVFQATGSYAIGLMLLSDVALAALVYCVVAMHPTTTRPGCTDHGRW
jgi:NNP family nitrate/nitrite transporter-like MFS transporter